MINPMEQQFNNIASFRLLNSEIGNDRPDRLRHEIRRFGFRLLNSEIGNDHEI